MYLLNVESRPASKFSDIRFSFEKFRNFLQLHCTVLRLPDTYPSSMWLKSHYYSVLKKPPAVLKSASKSVARVMFHRGCKLQYTLRTSSIVPWLYTTCQKNSLYTYRYREYSYCKHLFLRTSQLKFALLEFWRLSRSLVILELYISLLEATTAATTTKRQHFSRQE